MSTFRKPQVQEVLFLRHFVLCFVLDRPRQWSVGDGEEGA